MRSAKAVIAAFAAALVMAPSGTASAQSVPRLRSGVSLLIGPTIPGPGLAGGLEGRVGLQFNDTFALYAEPAILGGGSPSGGVLFVGGVSPIFEVALGDVFSLGAGPCLFGGFYASDTGNVEGGFVPGAKLKLSAGFGSELPARRHQFTIGLETHLLISRETGPGIFAALALGYDARLGPSSL